MKYSVLIHESKLDDNKLSILKEISSLFSEKDNCTQIVIGCDSDSIVKLSANPISKSMYVPMERVNYMTLFRGLKAIKEENVLIFNLSQAFDWQHVEDVLKNLEEYPAVSNKDIVQGFDTRLLMFSLQVAIEMNFALNSYGDVVKLADTPIRYIEG